MRYQRETASNASNYLPMMTTIFHFDLVNGRGIVLKRIAIEPSEENEESYKDQLMLQWPGTTLKWS